jgi:hypothetical protein
MSKCNKIHLAAALCQVQKQLEAPPKSSWLRQCGRIGFKVALVISFFAIGTLATSVWSSEVGAYFTGNIYLNQSGAFQLGYISGVADAFELIKSTQEKQPLGAPAANAMFVSCKGRMPNYQVKAIVDKYLKDHPENMDFAMADIVYGAVIDAGKKRGALR